MFRPNVRQLCAHLRIPCLRHALSTRWTSKQTSPSQFWGGAKKTLSKLSKERAHVLGKAKEHLRLPSVHEAKEKLRASGTEAKARLKVAHNKIKSVSTKVPDISGKISEIKIPELKLADIKIPDLPKIPNVKIPELKIRDLELPSVDLPKVTIPSVDLPSLSQLQAQLVHAAAKLLQTLPSHADVIAMYRGTRSDLMLYAELSELANLAQFRKYAPGDLASGLTLMLATNMTLKAASKSPVLRRALAITPWTKELGVPVVGPGGTVEAPSSLQPNVTDFDPVPAIRYCLFADAVYSKNITEFLTFIHKTDLPRWTEKDIPLVFNFAPTGSFERAFFFMPDPIRKELVMGVRGTKSFRDLFTNLATAPEPFLTGVAHAGMLRSALEFRVSVLDFLGSPLCKRWVEEYKLEKLAFVGHSLGAGTAALTTMMLRQLARSADPETSTAWPLPLDNTHCYGFGPPACVNGDFGSLEQYIYSFVLGDDLVPRLGTANIQEMRSDLMLYLEQGANAMVAAQTKRNAGLGDSSEPSTNPLVRLRPPGIVYSLSFDPKAVVTFTALNAVGVAQKAVGSLSGSGSGQGSAGSATADPAAAAATTVAVTATQGTEPEPRLSKSSFVLPTPAQVQEGIEAARATLFAPKPKQVPVFPRGAVQVSRANSIDDFNEIVFSRNMLSHHLLDSYHAAFRCLMPADPSGTSVGNNSTGSATPRNKPC